MATISQEFSNFNVRASTHYNQAKQGATAAQAQIGNLTTQITQLKRNPDYAGDAALQLQAANFELELKAAQTEFKVLHKRQTTIIENMQKLADIIKPPFQSLSWWN